MIVNQVQFSTFIFAAKTVVVVNCESLSPVGSNVGATVRAVVVGILARIYHIRNPEAGPADEQAQQSGEDVSFGRGFII